MFSPVDLKFLESQERESENCKSSETIKVLKKQFIVCVLNYDFSKKFCNVTNRRRNSYSLLLYGSVSQGLETTEFANLIG